MENVNSFKYVNEDGKEIVCDILFTFDSDETKKSYIVYTDNTTNNDDSLNVYASVYINGTLVDVLTDEEWNEIEKRLNKIQ